MGALVVGTRGLEILSTGGEGMRWYIVTGLAFVLATSAVAAHAQEAAEEAPEPKPAASAPDAVQVRAQWHKTMAALLAEQAKETPDTEKVAQLQKRLQNLRSKMGQTARPGLGRGPGAGVPGACPWAGTVGPRAGRRGPGMGPGTQGRFGPAAPGWGRGAGQGRGNMPAGMGRGAPRGRGMPGWGPGAGRGAGRGRGAGFGPGFVDRDGDGVCDYFQQRLPVAR